MIMQRFKAVYLEWNNMNATRLIIDIYARDLEQAKAKWCAMRTPDEDLLSLYRVVTPSEHWKSIGI
jgi:hypothetical protein